MSSAVRPHDIVVFGATGFTGQLVVRHLAHAAPAGVRWAIAGRSLDKLAQVAKDAGVDVPMLRVDVGDPASLLSMAQSTRVVLTTVGPYAKYGAALVSSCAREGTHYADLTGEVTFMRRTIAEYVSKGHIHLQETLCDAILARMLAHPKVKAARVSTEKPDVYPDCDAVGVEVFGIKES